MAIFTNLVKSSESCVGVTVGAALGIAPRMPRNFANGIEDKVVTKSRRVIIHESFGKRERLILVLGQQIRDLTSIPDRESIPCKSQPRELGSPIAVLRRHISPQETG